MFSGSGHQISGGTFYNVGGDVNLQTHQHLTIQDHRHLAPLIACCPQRLPQLNPVNPLVRLFPTKRVGASYLVSGLLLPPTHLQRRPAASGAAYRLSPPALRPPPLVPVNPSICLLPATHAGSALYYLFSWLPSPPAALWRRPPTSRSPAPPTCAAPSSPHKFNRSLLPTSRTLVARTTAITDSIETTKYLPRISHRQCLRSAACRLIPLHTLSLDHCSLLLTPPSLPPAIPTAPQEARRRWRKVIRPDRLSAALGDPVAVRERH
ncbi:hypothetical protein B0H14DRAFT_3503329 [Mycena olivaceomarginata]|nr:hypothetical protein B0H14DRAFT_3503329 [Mycena olivaceomarginata]